MRFTTTYFFPSLPLYISLVFCGPFLLLRAHEVDLGWRIRDGKKKGGGVVGQEQASRRIYTARSATMAALP